MYNKVYQLELITTLLVTHGTFLACFIRDLINLLMYEHYTVLQSPSRSEGLEETSQLDRSKLEYSIVKIIFQTRLGVKLGGLQFQHLHYSTFGALLW